MKTEEFLPLEVYPVTLRQIESSVPDADREIPTRWIMPETRFTEFLALFVDPTVSISWSALETDERLFFLPINGKIEMLTRIFTIYSVCQL